MDTRDMSLDSSFSLWVSRDEIGDWRSFARFNFRRRRRRWEAASCTVFPFFRFEYSIIYSVYFEALVNFFFVIIRVTTHSIHLVVVLTKYINYILLQFFPLCILRT